MMSSFSTWRIALLLCLAIGMHLTAIAKDEIDFEEEKLLQKMSLYHRKPFGLEHVSLEKLNSSVDEVESDFLFMHGESHRECPYFILVQDGGAHDFYTLRLTSNDCQNISKLIKDIAKLNLWELLKKSKELKKLGNKIEPVHPLRFLGYIFSNHDLKKHMLEIKTNYFKWNQFMDGLCNRLSEESQHNNLNRFIPGFCQIVRCQPSVIENFIHHHDWHGMINSMM